MNEQERSELERLKQQQARLAQELAQLSVHLNLLEQRLSQPQREGTSRAALKTENPPAAQAPPAQSVPTPTVRIPLVIPPPPVIARNSVPPVVTAPTVRTAPEISTPPPPRHPPVAEPPRPQLRVAVGEKNVFKGVCQHCGGHLEYSFNVVGDTIPCPHCGESTLLSAPAKLIPTPPPVARPVVPASIPPVRPHVPLEAVSAGKGSFEMRLGTYWLVRIGIVMVLTALVFFGNLAYQNFITKMGPGGKVTLLYLASAALLGAGGGGSAKRPRSL